MKRKCQAVKHIHHSDVAEFRHEFLKENREMAHRLDYMGKHLDKLWEHVSTTNERLQNLEIYVNILNRLVSTLCIEKMGIKLSALKKMLQHIENEAARDSQVNYLEELFRLDGRKRQDAGQERSQGDFTG
jgi:chromosome segregation ATPase